VINNDCSIDNTLEILTKLKDECNIEIINSETPIQHNYKNDFNDLEKTKYSNDFIVYSKLLEVGSILAAEKNQFESRIRRIKLACSRWKLSYQSEIHTRYREVTSLLEERYQSEITKLLEEIQDCKSILYETQKVVDMKEKELLKTHEMVKNYFYKNS
jgi:DNA gyrase/topoisomerase IV subunit A